MSYEIIYNKQFVRLRRTGEVIPMLLAGSNNCFEVGRGGRSGQRSRDWSNDSFYNRKGKISDKPEAIMGKVDAELPRRIRKRYDKEDKPADIRARFGYYAGVAVGGGHCGDTSWDKYRGVYANGIKNALSIEELSELGIHLYFHTVWFDEKPEGMPAEVPIKTECQYFEELKRWRAWQNSNGKSKSFWLGFSPRNTDVVLERLRAPKRKPPRERTPIEQDHYFVLVNDRGALLKYTSRGYQYAWSRGGGKQFRTEQAAERYRQQLCAKRRYMADTWKVERIDHSAVFQV